jgi:predicted HicB family RNase H-like nuclease
VTAYSVILSVRVQPEEAEEIREAARRAGLSVDGYIYKRIIDKSK